MRSRTTLALPAILLLASADAFAHGATPTPCVFTAPPALTASVSDAGDRVFAPYAWATADASYAITFTDGDVDPVAHDFFYYLPYAPPMAVGFTDIPTVATLIPDAPEGIWAACTCPMDFGAYCGDMGMRDCANGFTWDTSQVPAGAYWIIAETTDPPFDLYTVSEGPVLVSHGGAPPPPAAIALTPDGFGTFDTTYRVRWLMTGTAPFHVDLAYSEDADYKAGKPFVALASDVPLVTESDGSYYYDWDISQLVTNDVYYVKISVTDANGASYTESVAGLTVVHPGAHADMAIPAIGEHKGGCDSAPSRSSAGFVALFLASLLGVLVTSLVARRRT